MFTMHVLWVFHQPFKVLVAKALLFENNHTICWNERVKWMRKVSCNLRSVYQRWRYLEKENQITKLAAYAKDHSSQTCRMVLSLCRNSNRTRHFGSHRFFPHKYSARWSMCYVHATCVETGNLNAPCSNHKPTLPPRHMLVIAAPCQLLLQKQSQK